MAGTAIAAVTLRQPYIPVLSHTLQHSSLLPPIIHNHNKISGSCISKLGPICRAKLNDDVEEASERIKEAIFGSDEVIDEYDSDDEEEDDTESSIDLLFRFFQTTFKKVSKRARKASRSILPDVISPQLGIKLVSAMGNEDLLSSRASIFRKVSFAVDGVLLLASLSILKALLEVICTLGGTVFMAILLLRVVWSAVSYFQSSGIASRQSRTSHGRTQPVT